VPLRNLWSSLLRVLVNSSYCFSYTYLVMLCLKILIQCRAVAAAVFGDGSRAEPVVVSGEEWFGSLANRSVDLLPSLSSHTMDRDVYNVSDDILTECWTNMMLTSVMSFLWSTRIQEDEETGFSFSVPLVYSGLVFAGVPPFGACANNLSPYFGECIRLRVCVSNVTTHLPIVERLLPRTSIVVTETPIRDFLFGLCNAVTGEAFLLSEAQMRNRGYTGEYEVGENVFSRTPIATVTRDNDPEWSDFVNWVTQALFAAEEQGIMQDNAADLPTVSVFGDQFENMFIDAVAAVGNYGEIYERNLEAISPRQSLNFINTNGSTGLLYSPPFGEVQVNGPGPSRGGILEKIASRGELRCGISVRAGFADFDQNTGNWSGLDADYCYALSASIFNSSESIAFVNLPATEERYMALVTEEVDVLTGGSLNLVNDAQFSFSQPYFYDPPTGVAWSLP